MNKARNTVRAVVACAAAFALCTVLYSAGAVAQTGNEPPATTSAATPSEIAAQAQASYDRGIELRRADPTASVAAFRQSARDWQRLVDGGASNGPLHFNLGNAYFQAGDLGRAIANYLRAERTMPDDADLSRNLGQARSAVQHLFAPASGTLLVESVARWWHLVPRGTRVGLAWGAWFAFWAVLLIRLVRPQFLSGTHARNTARKLVLAGTAAVWVILGGTLLADEAIHRTRAQGVLVAADVHMRKGNGEGFEPAFAEALGPGVEFAIREERPGWWRIELPDGRSGWIKDAQGVRI